MTQTDIQNPVRTRLLTPLLAAGALALMTALPATANPGHSEETTDWILNGYEAGQSWSQADEEEAREDENGAGSLKDVALQPAESATLIRGATVYTMGRAGTLKKADVLITGSRISEVGSDISAPAGTRIVSGADKIITPGFMTSFSALGLVEINAVAETRDDRSFSDAPYSAAVTVVDGLNPNSTLLPITRMEGVTRAVTAPQPGKSIFAGQTAVIHLGPGPDLVVRKEGAPAAAQFVAMGQRGKTIAGGSRPQAWAFLRDAFAQAKVVDTESGPWPFRERDHITHPVLTVEDLRALREVVRGNQPLLVHVNRASDIRATLREAKSLGIRVILLQAAEAWQVADEIAAAGVPVILHPFDNLPARFETLTARLDNAAILHEAGVKIAFSYFDTHNERLLPQAAGNAVANGLPYEAALAALTINPAQIWGIDASYGSLERGKDADVVIWDGDPLEVMSAPEAVFIRGKAMTLTSRQTALRDRYKDLSRQALPFQYR